MKGKFIMSLFENYVPFKKSLEEYIENYENIFNEIGDRGAANLVKGFVSDLEQQRYNITIVGSFNRGKSTLLNTLMERENDDISPISGRACTSAIIKYNDKNLPANPTKGCECAVIYFNEESSQPQIIPLSRLKEFATEANNSRNQKNVRSIQVYGDFPEWSQAVTIVDSPGQNTVYSHHDTLLTDFLPYTDAIILLIAADLPVDGGDLNLLNELSEEEKKKIFFVLTKVDELDNKEDLQDVIKTARDAIQSAGLNCEKLYCTSAKTVYAALTKGIKGEELKNLKTEHGLAELEADLEKFIVSESEQTDIIRKRIETLLCETKKACNDYIEGNKRLLKQSDYDLVKLQAEKTGLIDANTILRENTEKALKKFDRTWKKTLNSFQRKFAVRAGAIEDKIYESLGKGGLLGAVFQSFKLQQQVEKAVYLELNPILSDIAEQLNEAVETLSKDIDNELELYSRRKNGRDILTVYGGIAGGAAVAGTVAWGASISGVAISNALTAFNTWATASAAAAKAAAETSLSSMGLGPWLWRLLTGPGKDVVITTGDVAYAGTAAIVAGISAVVTTGVSILVSIIVQKILTLGLIQWQSSRVTVLTEKIMNEMEEELLKSLAKYKDSIIAEYKQNIEDTIADNTERLAKIEKICSEDNTDEIKLIEGKIERVKSLLQNNINIQKQLPSIG